MPKKRKGPALIPWMKDGEEEEFSHSVSIISLNICGTAEVIPRFMGFPEHIEFRVSDWEMLQRKQKIRKRLRAMSRGLQSALMWAMFVGLAYLVFLFLLRFALGISTTEVFAHSLSMGALVLITLGVRFTWQAWTKPLDILDC
jgi:hypothetical protein